MLWPMRKKHCIESAYGSFFEYSDLKPNQKKIKSTLLIVFSDLVLNQNIQNIQRTNMDCIGSLLFTVYLHAC